MQLFALLLAASLAFQPRSAVADSSRIPSAAKHKTCASLQKATTCEAKAGCTWLNKACVEIASLDIFGCVQDSDCVAIPLAPPNSGCCNNGWLIAVNSTKVDLYNETTKCNVKGCPQYVVKDERVSICTFSNHTCAMIAPAAIVCGGGERYVHSCTSSYSCIFPNPPEIGGSGLCYPDCTKFQTRNATSHVCEPNAACSPTHKCPSTQVCSPSNGAQTKCTKASLPCLCANVGGG